MSINVQYSCLSHTRNAKYIPRKPKKLLSNSDISFLGLRLYDILTKDLKNNLYKIWNCMSSGSYFPPAVRWVEIAKKGGGLRELDVPTVSDWIAQMVAKMYFEPEVDHYFHPDSYGYRPGKSAIEAVGVIRDVRAERSQL